MGLPVRLGIHHHVRRAADRVFEMEETAVI